MFSFCLFEEVSSNWWMVLGPIDYQRSWLETAIRKLNRVKTIHKGVKTLLSFRANAVFLIPLVRPTYLKSPIARNKKMIAMPKVAYRIYLLLTGGLKKPLLLIVMPAKRNKPTAITKVPTRLGINTGPAPGLEGNAAVEARFPPSAQ